MNIYDYLKWRGDLTFKADPFNEVDNLILSTLSYVNFKDIVPADGTVLTISEAIKSYFKKYRPTKEDFEKGFTSSVPVLVNLMGKTARFGNLTLHNEKTVNDESVHCQFSAITIDIDARTSFISFRGTDNTLNGWQEDFEISYRETEAQKLAVEYLENNVRGLFHKYMVGGHSKGGNLAQYAANKCSPSVRKKIIALYSNDGPGIYDGLFDENTYQELKPIYKKYVPTFSVFGRMFDGSDSNIIVESDASLIMQHSPDSWQIEGNHFVKAEDFDPDSRKLMEEFEAFLKDVPIDKREIFSKQLFKAFKDAGYNEVSEFAKIDPKAILAVIDNMNDMDADAKKVAIRLIKVILYTLSDKAKGMNPFKKK